MTGGWAGSTSPATSDDEDRNGAEDLEEIKKQLADLQDKLSKLK
jgi:hypothetical protein